MRLSYNFFSYKKLSDFSIKGHANLVKLNEWCSSPILCKNLFKIEILGL